MQRILVEADLGKTKNKDDTPEEAKFRKKMTDQLRAIEILAEKEGIEKYMIQFTPEMPDIGE